MDRAKDPHEPRNLTTTQAADYLSLARATLEKYRSIGAGPAFRKLGRAVRYTLEDLNEWNDARTCTSTVDRNYANASITRNSRTPGL